MSSPQLHLVPPDQAQREAALRTDRSVLVQAPAGSGKTSLLTQRFLALLGQVDDPSQIVAITFTRAAAAEMRTRILSELEKAAAQPDAAAGHDALSTAVLARRALSRSQQLGWNLLDQPSQLRISTIDSFCREIALQEPLVSGLGGNLEISGQPDVLYRRAARRVLEQLDDAPFDLRQAVETLLLWRDNNWQEMEQLLVKMLGQRDRWMRDFVLDREPDLDALRERLERPFAKAVATAMERVSRLLDQAPGARDEILALARFACEQTGGARHRELAQTAGLPAPSFESPLALDDARLIYAELAELLLIKDGALRRRADKNLGFPSDRKREKERFLNLTAGLGAIAGFAEALAAVRSLPPARYTEDDWRIVRSAFTLLAHAAAQLRIVFAEEGACDYTEIAQTALNVLKGEQGLPGDSTLALVEGIRHLLIDEFQDTSRRQHELLAHLIAAWPDMEGRTCFVVGDPMQSIYFFRDAEAELFSRVRDIGLETPGAEPLAFDSVRLKANFRTAPTLVEQLNSAFQQVFAKDDGSGIQFAAAAPARQSSAEAAAFDAKLELHLDFVPTTAVRTRSGSDSAGAREELLRLREEAKTRQIDEIVGLIATHQAQMDRLLARKRDDAPGAAAEKYRVAVLGRSRKALMPIAEALHKARIPFRAVDLEELKDRPEIVDALSLARALFNPQDRVAWLGLLRAPWCGLSLADLHTLSSADDAELMDRPLPALLDERVELLSQDGRRAARRVLAAVGEAAALRSDAPVAALGSWLEQVWTRLGGPLCVDATALANLELLWKALDNLPENEQDLLGPALDAALADLTAQPDPAVDENCGVQLMTIHKSKGLEFEVVTVPELQALSGKADTQMLSWLERGLAEADDSGEPTEFLVAPLQTRGAERGNAKAWVDSARRTREQQEMRRLLYVASTRAREELHLFARPGYKAQPDGALTLAAPRSSLLATAWPALAAEIEKRFAQWTAAQSQAEASAEESTLESLAASALIVPAAARPTRLLRLPPDLSLDSFAGPTASGGDAVASPTLYTRHEGGLRSRALGTAVHALFEELARLCTRLAWEQARAELSQFAPRTAASIRSAGIDKTQAEAMAQEACGIAVEASRTPEGEWILSPHPDADSELRWTGVLGGTLRTVQVDRIFRAGAEPLSSGGDVWWIVDYKTAHADGLDPQTALSGLRSSFAPQLEIYAQALRNLKGAAIEIRAALYYPRMKALDWWKI